MSETQEARWEYITTEEGYGLLDTKRDILWGMTKDFARPQVLADYVNALEDALSAAVHERDEAVRRAEELEAKAALADEVFGGKWFEWYNAGLEGCYACIYCDAEALNLDLIEHNGNCPKLRYDALTPIKASSPEAGI